MVSSDDSRSSGSSSSSSRSCGLCFSCCVLVVAVVVDLIVVIVVVVTAPVNGWTVNTLLGCNLGFHECEVFHWRFHGTQPDRIRQGPKLGRPTNF